MKQEVERTIHDIPYDVLGSCVFRHLPLADKLLAVPLVCKAWRDVLRNVPGSVGTLSVQLGSGESATQVLEQKDFRSALLRSGPAFLSWLDAHAGAVDALALSVCCPPWGDDDRPRSDFIDVLSKMVVPALSLLRPGCPVHLSLTKEMATPLSTLAAGLRGAVARSLHLVMDHPVTALSSARGLDSRSDSLRNLLTTTWPEAPPDAHPILLPELASIHDAFPHLTELTVGLSPRSVYDRMHYRIHVQDPVGDRLCRTLLLPRSLGSLSQLRRLTVQLRGVGDEPWLGRLAPPARSVVGLSALTALTALTVSDACVDVADVAALTGLRELSLHMAGVEFDARHDPTHLKSLQSLTSLDRLSVTMWSLADEMGLSCALSDLAFCPDTHVRLLLPSSDAAPSPETVTAPHRVLHTCARLEPFRHGCLRVSYHRACVGVAIADDLGPTLRLVPLDGALYAHDVPNAESRETACLSRTAGPGEVQAALDKPWVQVVDLGGASVISQDPGRALWFPTNRRVTLRNGTLAVAGGAVVPDGADVTLSGVVVVGSEAHGVTVLRGGRARVGGQSQILACQRAGLANVGGGYLEVTEHSCASGNAVGLLVHGVHGALGNTVIDRAFFLDNAACGIAVDDLPAHAHAHASGGSAAPGPVALYATSPFCARNGVGLRVRGCVAAKVVRGVFVSQAGSGVEVEDEGHVDLDTVAVWWSGAYGVHIKNPTPTNTSPGPCTLTPHSFVRNRKGDVMTGNLVVNFPVPGPGLPEASGAAARGARGDEAVEWASQQELLGHLLQVTSDFMAYSPSPTPLRTPPASLPGSSPLSAPAPTHASLPAHASLPDASATSRHRYSRHNNNTATHRTHHMRHADATVGWDAVAAAPARSSFDSLPLPLSIHEPNRHAADGMWADGAPMSALSEALQRQHLGSNLNAGPGNERSHEPMRGNLQQGVARSWSGAGGPALRYQGGEQGFTLLGGAQGGTWEGVLRGGVGAVGAAGQRRGLGGGDESGVAAGVGAGGWGDEGRGVPPSVERWHVASLLQAATGRGGEADFAAGMARWLRGRAGHEAHGPRANGNARAGALAIEGQDVRQALHLSDRPDLSGVALVPWSAGGGAGAMGASAVGAGAMGSTMEGGRDAVARQLLAAALEALAPPGPPADREI